MIKRDEQLYKYFENFSKLDKKFKSSLKLIFFHRCMLTRCNLVLQFLSHSLNLLKVVVKKIDEILIFKKKILVLRKSLKLNFNAKFCTRTRRRVQLDV